MTAKGNWAYDRHLIIELCDGKRTSKEIADIVGCPTKHVQKIMKLMDLPRLPQAPRMGKHNPSFVSGRRIDRNGYALVTAPKNHPHQRRRKNRHFGIILEHRLIAEQIVGRYLDPLEVVDHIDGLTLHNDISNLRIFDSNGQHLERTIAGCRPNWSDKGLANIRACRPIAALSRVDIYKERLKRGEIRLQQILLAWLQLGKDSPYLLGTHQWLNKIGIDYSEDSKILACAEKLQQRWEQGRFLFE